MNNKTGFAIAAIAIVAALLVTTSAMNPTNAFAGGHYKKRTTQTLTQVNECGNGTMPLKVDCQNAASQIQGKGNAAASSSFTRSCYGGHNGGFDDGQKAVTMMVRKAVTMVVRKVVTMMVMEALTVAKAATLMMAAVK